jgi:hypothetical protein
MPTWASARSRSQQMAAASLTGEWTLSLRSQRIHFLPRRGRLLFLEDGHAIAVTVEAITLTDCFFVRAENEFPSRKRTHQHQQGRAG